MPLHINTPLLESPILSRHCGRQVWLKMDALQPPGSFKIRGVGHACEYHYRQGARRFVSSSGGNAGLAVAYAGRRLGAAVTVVVPESTTERAKSMLQLEQAELIVHGDSWQEANQHALSLVGASDAFIHPFDDPLLWAGHASLVDEVYDAGLKPDAVVLCVGGGGLLAGVAEGLLRQDAAAVPILTVETEGAASLHQSILAGEQITLPAITSVASSLGAKRICDQAWALTSSRRIISTTVSDRAALEACERFVDDHRVLVEPACGASLALVYQQAPELAGFEKLLVIACGGATMTMAQMRSWMGEPA